jgi:2-polyprenyl-3-methyl-5-hydroxy-6-metoxy-1,4-benzoquinol methylase
MTRTCPLCGGALEPLFAKAGRDYAECRSCGLQSAEAGSSNANFPASIDQYEPAYRQYLDSDPEDAAREDDVIAWVERRVDLKPPGARVLDVGAGGGKFLRRVRETRPCTILGLEPSMPLVQQYALADLGVLPLTLPELVARHPEPFDAITALDVIEHVPRAREFVDALFTLTRPGGFVFVSTPDARGVLARLLGRFWHHYNPYHYTLYDARSLNCAARLAGFSTVEAGHRARRMSLRYLWSYLFDFVLRRRRSRPSGAVCGGLSIDVNLGDVISVVWQKAA